MNRSADTPVSGPTLFARYAYPPNALGYCGPDDADALLDLATREHRDDRDLRHLASQFEGAWPYLELIATCNDIRDPLDIRVVEAYWVGNGLLARVPPAALWRSLDDRFRRRAGRLFEPMAAAVPLGGAPHHSFHVFAVYPWLGMLRAGLESPALTVLDRCRIRWGTVESVEGDQVLVRSRLLTFRGSRLQLGDADQVEVVRRSIDSRGFVGELAPGDAVTLHWDWICDRIDARRLLALQRWSAQTLAVVNATPAPGPAVAADASGGGAAH